MLTILIKRLSITVAMLFMAGGLAFGVTQAFATTSAPPCDLGTCPPKTNSSCNTDCVQQLQAFGGECQGGCCMCFF